MKNKRWYFRSYRKLACQFVFLPSEWYHVFLNKNNSWKFSNKRSLSVFFHEMCVYWAALLWTLPALATREDVTRSPWMSGTSTGLGMSSTTLGIQASTEASKGRAAEESGDCAFLHPLLRSSCPMWAPSKGEKWRTDEHWSSPSPAFGKKKT